MATASLAVRVVRGVGLANRDWGKQDPYVVAWVETADPKRAPRGRHKGKGAAPWPHAATLTYKKGGQDPVFTEEHGAALKLDLSAGGAAGKPPAELSLILEAWDDDGFSGDDLIGVGQVALADIAAEAGKPLPLTVSLTKKKKDAGKIEVVATYTPAAPVQRPAGTRPGGARPGRRPSRASQGRDQRDDHSPVGDRSDGNGADKAGDPSGVDDGAGGADRSGDAAGAGGAEEAVEAAGGAGGASSGPSIGRGAARPGRRYKESTDGATTDLQPASADDNADRDDDLAHAAAEGAGGSEDAGGAAEQSTPAATVEAAEEPASVEAAEVIDAPPTSPASVTPAPTMGKSAALQVSVKRGIELKSQDFGKQDPYVVVWVEERPKEKRKPRGKWKKDPSTAPWPVARTRTVSKGGTDPTFGEELRVSLAGRFSGASPDDICVFVEAWDEDTLSDDLIGVATLTLAEAFAADGETIKVEAQLTDAKKGKDDRGRVELELTYLSDVPSAVELASSSPAAAKPAAVAAATAEGASASSPKKPAQGATAAAADTAGSTTPGVAETKPRSSENTGSGQESPQRPAAAAMITSPALGSNALLYVEIQRGVKLKSQDFGKQDPYVVVWVEERPKEKRKPRGKWKKDPSTAPWPVARTRTVSKGGTDPTFGEELRVSLAGRFSGASPDDICVFVEAWDEDTLSDDLIGVATLTLAEAFAADGETVKVEAQLTDAKKGKDDRGRLELALTFVEDARVLGDLAETGGAAGGAGGASAVPATATVSAVGSLVLRVLAAELLDDKPAMKDPVVSAWVEMEAATDRRPRGKWKATEKGQVAPPTTALTGEGHVTQTVASWGAADGQKLELSLMGDSGQRQCVWVELWSGDTFVGAGAVPELQRLVDQGGESTRLTVPVAGAESARVGLVRVDARFSVDGPAPARSSALAATMSAESAAAERARQKALKAAEAAEAKQRAVAREKAAARAAIDPCDVYGLLSIDCVSGSSMAGSDFMGKSDPYVVFYIEPATQSTTSGLRPPRGRWPSKTKPPASYAATGVVTNGGAAPVWTAAHGGRVDVALAGAVEGDDRVVLWVEAWDEDDFNKDDFIGMAAVSLREVVLDGGEGLQRQGVKLTSTDGTESRGELMLGLGFAPKPRGSLGDVESAADSSRNAALVVAAKGDKVPGMTLPPPKPVCGELIVKVTEAMNLPPAVGTFVRLSLRPGNEVATTTPPPVGDSAGSSAGAGKTGGGSGGGKKKKVVYDQTLVMALINDVPEPSKQRDPDAVLSTLVVEVVERDSAGRDTVIAEGGQPLDALVPPATGAPAVSSAGAAAATDAPSTTVTRRGRKPPKDSDPSAGAKHWVTLEPKRATRSSRPPQICLRLRFRRVASAKRLVTEASLLRVFVLRARGLQAIEALGQRDPYVRLQLVSGDPPTSLPFSREAVTGIAVESGRRAVWNESFDVAIAAGVDAPVLVAEVVDKESGAADTPFATSNVVIDDVVTAGDTAATTWVSLTGPGRRAPAKKGKKSKGKRGSGSPRSPRGKRGATSAEESIGELRLGFQLCPLPEDPVASAGVFARGVGAVVHLLVVGVRFAGSAFSEAECARMSVCVHADGRPAPASAKKRKKARAKKGARGAAVAAGDVDASRAVSAAFTTDVARCRAVRDAAGRVLRDADLDDGNPNTVFSGVAVWNQYTTFAYKPPAAATAPGSATTPGAAAATTEDGAGVDPLRVAADAAAETQTVAAYQAGRLVEEDAARAEIAGKLDKKKAKGGKKRRTAAAAARPEVLAGLAHLWLGVSNTAGPNSGLLGATFVPLEALWLDADSVSGGLPGAGHGGGGSSRKFEPLDRWLPLQSPEDGSHVGDLRIAAVCVPGTSDEVVAKAAAESTPAADAASGGAEGAEGEPVRTGAEHGVLALKDRAAGAAGSTDAAATSERGRSKAKREVPPVAQQPSPGIVSIEVLRARGLQPATPAASSALEAPFVEMNVLSGGVPTAAEPGGSSGVWRSTTVAESVGAQPEWEETIVAECDDAFVDVLRIRIRDRRAAADSLVGECVIPLCSLTADSVAGNEAFVDGGRLWYQLWQSGKPAGQVLLHMRFQPSPAAAIRVSELAATGMLFVQCVRASGLKDMEGLGRLDPVVGLRVVPGTAEALRTRVADKGGTEPVWDETLSLPYDGSIAMEAARRGTCPILKIDVTDAGAMHAALGSAALSLAAVLCSPGTVFEREVSLTSASSNGTSPDASLGIILCRIMFCDSGLTEVGGLEDDDATDESTQAQQPKAGVGGVPSRAAAEAMLREGPPRGIGSQSRPISGRLVLHVVRARHMAALRRAGTTIDVAAALAMMPKGLRVTTRPATATAGAPHFDEEVSLAVEDSAMQVVSVSVDDPTSGVSFGSVDVPLYAFMRSATVPQLAEDDTATDEAEHGVELWLPLFSHSGSASSRAGDVLVRGSFVPDPAETASSGALAPLTFASATGSLHVQVIRAEGLPVGRLTGGGDPFARLVLTDESGNEFWDGETAPAAGGGDTPSWREHLVVPVSWHPAEGNIPLLHLRLHTTGAGPTAGSAIASTVVHVSPFVLFPTQVAISWFPLGADGADGRVKLAVQFVPDAGSPVVPPQGRASKRAVKRAADQAATAASAFPNAIMRSITDACFAGELHVQVAEARELRSVQLIGALEPFVRVRVLPGGAKAASKVATDAGVRATWNEHLLLEYTTRHGASGDGVTPLLFVEVCNKGPTVLDADTVLGSCVVPVFPFAMGDGHVQSQWFPLQSRDGHSGEVRLAVEFIPDTPDVGSSGGLSAVVAQGDGEDGDGAVPVEVRVLEGRALRNVKWLDRLTPFVEVSIVGDDGEPLRTSRAESEAAAPSWHEKLQLTTRHRPDGSQPQLLCVVYNGAEGDAAEIGRCVLPLAMPPRRGTAEAKERIEAAALGARHAKVAGYGAAPGGKAQQHWVKLRTDGELSTAGELKLSIAVGGAALPSTTEETGVGVVHVSVSHGVGLGDEREQYGLRVGMNPGTAVRETALAHSAKADAAATAHDALHHVAIVTKPLSYDPLGSTAAGAAGDADAGAAAASASASASAGGEEPTWMFSESFVLPCLSARRMPSLRFELRKRGLLGSSGAGWEGNWSLQQVIENPGHALARWTPLQPSTDGPVKPSSASVGPNGKPRTPQAFVSARFMPHMEGEVRVVIVGGRRLRRTTAVGSQNPYVLVKLLPGRKSHKTGPAEGNDSASWNEEIMFDYSNMRETEAPRVRVVVKTNATGTTAVIGAVEVPIEGALAQPGRKRQQWYTLRHQTADGQHHESGEVLVGIKFTPAAVDVAAIEAARAGGTTEAVSLAVRTFELKKLFYGMAGGDGVVSKGEMQEALESNVALRNVLHASGDDPANVSKVFQDMDTNADGQVSWNEFLEFVNSVGQAAKLLAVGVEDSSDDEESAANASDTESSDNDNGSAAGETGDGRLAASRDRHQGKPSARRISPRRRSVGADDGTQPRPRSPATAPATQTAGAAVRRPPPPKVRKPPPLPSNPQQWRTLHVVTWVGEWQELPQYAASFATAAIDGPMLLTLSEEEMRTELGVSSTIHRAKLVRGIAALRGEKVGVGGLVRKGGGTVGKRRRRRRSRAGRRRRGGSRSRSKSRSRSRLAHSDEFGRGEVVFGGPRPAIDFAQQNRLRLTQTWAHAQAKKRQQHRRGGGHAGAATTEGWRFEYDRPQGGVDAAMTEAMGSTAGSTRPLRRRRLPADASLQEARAAVRRAILQFGSTLPAKSDGGAATRPASGPYSTGTSAEFGAGGGDEGFATTMHLLRGTLTGEGAGGVEEDTGAWPPAEVAPEDRRTSSRHTDGRDWGPAGDAASAVFDIIVNLKNNGAAWLGQSGKMTRIKLEGGLRAVLHLDVSWFSFDRLFESLNVRGDGIVHRRDFIRLVEPDLPLSAEERRAREKRADGPGDASRFASPTQKDGEDCRTALFALCDALENADMEPLEAFAAFDTSGNREVSISEFASLVKKVGGVALPRSFLAALHAAFDADGSRSISVGEFTDLLGVVWAQRFLRLERRLALRPPPPSGRPDSASGLSRRVRRLEDRLTRHYGEAFRDLAFAFGPGGSDLPRAFNEMLVAVGVPDEFTEAHGGAGGASGRAGLGRSHRSGRGQRAESPLDGPIARSHTLQYDMLAARRAARVAERDARALALPTLDLTDEPVVPWAS